MADEIARRRGMFPGALHDYASEMSGADEANIRVDASEAMQLLERAAAELKDPFLGVELGRRHAVERPSLLEYLVLTSSSLGDALDVATRYVGLASTGACYERFSRDGWATVSRAMPDASHFVQAEYVSVSWYATMARWGTGNPDLPMRLGVTHPRPESHRALARAIGVDCIEFGSSTTTIAFRERDLLLPMETADPDLSRTLRRHAESRLALEDSWLGRVRTHLTTNVGSGPITLESAARDLATSPRALQRHLRDAGTTWRTELDNMRIRRAIELLARTGLPVSGIAHRLGYSDARAFRRAFRRVTGRSPHEHRREFSA